MANTKNISGYKQVLQILGKYDSKMQEEAVSNPEKVKYRAITLLIKTLDDNFWLNRDWAARMLGGSGSRRAIWPLIKKVNEDDKVGHVRENAVKALWELTQDRYLFSSKNDEQSLKNALEENNLLLKLTQKDIDRIISIRIDLMGIRNDGERVYLRHGKDSYFAELKYGTYSSVFLQMHSVGIKDKRMVKPLIGKVNAKYGGYFAVAALGNLGPMAKEAIGPLTKALERNERRMKRLVREKKDDFVTMGKVERDNIAAAIAQIKSNETAKLPDKITDKIRVKSDMGKLGRGLTPAGVMAGKPMKTKAQRVFVKR